MTGAKKVRSKDEWLEMARALPAERARVTVPLHVLFGEAVDAQRFVGKYWAAVLEPRTKRVIRPGLELVAGAKAQRGITAHTADELGALRELVQQAQSAYLLEVDPKRAEGAFERGTFVVGEISAALEYLFDDGVEDENDAQLAKVSEEHRDDPSTNDALASELDDYAALGERHRRELDGLGGFDLALIGEAREIAAGLRERPATPAASATQGRASEALDLRNRLGALLQAEINDVRSAARFVFRHHPEIVREATSAYERRRRAAARRARAKTPADQSATPPAR